LVCRAAGSDLKAIHAQAQRDGVARQGHLDGLAGELVGVAVQERVNGQRRFVARALRTPFRVSAA